ncbi:MAG: DUF2799 domain-containing protein [Gammaproteobacteria bacterium]|nr:DUF2799 domain-containing protein [Gammaproteobacteria bacterium]
MKKLSLLLLPMMLAGCAHHLSQDECLATNWFAVGQADGIAGHTPQDLKPAIEDCAKFKIAVDTNKYMSGWHNGMKPYCAPSANSGYSDAVAGTPINSIMQRAQLCAQAGLKLNVNYYRAGWRKGIPLYCTFENGMHYSQEGQPLPAVCPPNLQKRFEDGWRRGQDQFCNQPPNAYAMGRDGKDFPEICNSNLFAAFRGEYERGLNTKHTIDDLNSKISNLKSQIDSDVFHYSFKETSFGYYEMDDTSIQNDEGKAALVHVNQMVQEKKYTEAQVTNLQLMH